MTASKSVMLYVIAIAKVKLVMKPMIQVLTRARGTAIAAFAHSSARWIAPSIPEYMKFGVTSPVMKTTPPFVQPLILVKYVQTNSLVCFVVARETQVMTM